MQTPTVSFIVPCYKLAHLLSECVQSILNQSYGDFEILIMDDCSPDNTPEVAKSFTDSRVQHVRNEPNLGHLRNYNKGIQMSRGRYVWLISADDYLGKPYLLERYVRLLDENPQVGFVFCPAVAVGGGAGTNYADYAEFGKAIHGDKDGIIKGHELLDKLLVGNSIVAASGLVRRECYNKHGLFPLNMPWAGDWYLWCLFALHHDVGYFAEPMVCYREHELSMTTQLWEKDVNACCVEDVAIPWVIKVKAQEAGFQCVVRKCLSALAIIYARNLTAKKYRMADVSMNLHQFEKSILDQTCNPKEQSWLRARTYSIIADRLYSQKERELSRRYYFKALANRWWSGKLLLKWLLTGLGPLGEFMRKCFKKSPSLEG